MVLLEAIVRRRLKGVGLDDVLIKRLMMAFTVNLLDSIHEGDVSLLLDYFLTNTIKCAII